MGGEITKLERMMKFLFTIQITELTFVKFCTGGFFSHGMQQCVMLLAVFVPLKTL